MRVVIHLLGTELVAIETGSPADSELEDESPAGGATAGTSLAGAELGATALGFTAPWRHVERDDPEDTHGRAP